MSGVEIVGRSSSHFTRLVRIFAHELGVEHSFRPVMDLTSLDLAVYAGNPALKIPTLVTGEGHWFGSENICRELARLADRRADVVLRGDVADRLVANAEELTLQAMTTEVSFIMAKMSGADRVPPKLLQGLENSLQWLDQHVDETLGRLPPGRALGFLDVSLFCLVTHLPFREVLDPSPYARLIAHRDRFGARKGARQTEYRYDAA